MQPNQPVDTSRSVFVTGSPRSGTSALAWALAQHPEMWTGPEAFFPYYLSMSGELDRIWERCSAREDGWITRHGVSREEFLACMGVGVDQVFLRRSKGRRWIDSNPRTVLVAPRLARLLPNARFVHILRDGRFVVSSLVRMSELRLASRFEARKGLRRTIRMAVGRAVDFRRACRTWVRHVEAGRRLAGELPDRVLEVRHERLSGDPESVMREVQEFLGLEPSPRPAELLRAHRVNSSYGNESLGDVKKPKPLSVLPETPWRDWTRAEKRVFRRTASDTMRELGYEVDLD